MKRALLLLSILSFLVISGVLAQDSRGLTLSVKQLNKNYAAGRQYVLLIAIDRYERWPALRNPVKDARELKEILTADYYVDEFIELYDAAATKANIIKTLGGLQKKLQTNDSLLIYYAGHGHLDQLTNTGFWIPVNAGTDKFEQANWLPNMQLRGLLSNLRSIHVLVISDSCFSGDLLNASRSLPDEIDNAYFAKAYARISRQILSSGASETVPDESEFTRMLKLALRKNESPYLDPLMLYNDIRLGVKGTLPMYGNLKDTGHQDGASFLLFRKAPEKREEPVVKEETKPRKEDKGRATAVTASMDRSFIDEFDGPALGAGWTWVRENPAKWSLKERPGSLFISTETGDLYESNNDCRNLLLRDPGMSDFTIETKVEFRPVQPNHQAGIVVYLDDGNFVSLVYGVIPAEDTGSTKIALLREIENGCTRKVTELRAERVYLRIVKVSDTYTGYYSPDGISYTAVGKFPINLGGVPQVGLYACAGFDAYWKANPRNTAYFDYFSIYPNGQPILRKEEARKETKKADAAAVVKNKPAPEPALLKGEFRDSFDGPPLAPGWSWLRENPAKWSLTERPGSLLISTELGDLFASENNAKNVLLREPGAADFTLETKLEFQINIHYQQAGIVVYLDDDNYVAALFGSHPNDDLDANSVPSRKVGLITEKKANVRRVLLPHAGETVCLRIVKKGDTYGAFFSADGVAFSPIGEFPIELQGTPRVGLLAYSGNESYFKLNPKGSAYFEYFKISAGDQPVVLKKEKNAAATSSARYTGPIVLDPSDATLIQKGSIRYERGRLCYWNNLGDQAGWRLVIPEDGEYAVLANYSCDTANYGSTVRLTVGDHSLEFIVRGTASFEDFQTSKIGKLKLKAGTWSVTVQAVKMAGGYVMDLGGLRFVKE